MFFQFWQIRSSVNLLFSVIPENMMKNHKMMSAVWLFANTSDHNRNSLQHKIVLEKLSTTANDTEIDTF